MAAPAKNGGPRAPASFKECRKGGWEGRLPAQLAVKRYYETAVSQWLVAAVIVLNFLVTVAEKEIDPFERSIQQLPVLWLGLDITFTTIFVVELIINMYANWLCLFWLSGWNVFDFVIVLISVLNLTGALAGVGFLKTLRTFRVFRLFKRVKALNEIITALMRAIPGMMNAFLIMLLVISLYAIIGVELFSTFGANGSYVTVQQEGVGPDATYPETAISSGTVRGFHYGQEYFGTFSRALFTQFQVLTGESWAEVVARPLLFGYAPWSAFGVAFYFVSYVILLQIGLVNVVVAVLLEKFTATDNRPMDDSAWDGVPDGVWDDRDPSTPSPGAAASIRPAAQSSAPPTERSSGGASRAELSESVAAARAELHTLYERLESVDAMQQQLTQLASTVDSVASAAPALRAFEGWSEREIAALRMLVKTSGALNA